MVRNKRTSRLMPASRDDDDFVTMIVGGEREPDKIVWEYI